MYVTAGPGPEGHGGEYNLMSFEPFKFEAGYRAQNRILTSLIAHYVYYLPFFPYHDFTLFIDVIGVFFISCVYVAARGNGLSPVISIMGACVMTFSTPVLYFIYYPGYTDITSYTLIFLAMCAVRNNLVWPWLLALSLLNHESNFFAYPWFLFLYYLRNDRKISRTAVAVLLMTLSAVPWYYWVNYVASHHPPTYSVSYYLNASMRQTLRLVSGSLHAGFFQAFKLFWIIPAYAICAHLRDRKFAEAALYVLIVSCAMAQLALAWDTSRLLSASFPVIFLGFVTLAQRWERVLFQKIMSNLIVINLLVPQYYVGQQGQVRFYSTPVSHVLRTYLHLRPRPF